ncbi:hypothetical protein [Natronorubrum texcoconense]|uniref:DUF8152 domain-containing protein n=1 Tax=Natronorubrum texcoconense TaxID=1095776 RepID=A0A1G9E6T4_9EURY|nr:hypothetical protein [Natronorubrum texcoconense]SDK71824.1 hypothetical protein SAMN04515672_3782 [Natronorubrum texcoconense]
MTDDSHPARTANGAEDSLEDQTQQLHRHLEHTAELPIDRDANRWLGEADAIARDVATSDLEREVVVERVEKIQHLLSEVDETGHVAGDEHLEAPTGGRSVRRNFCAARDIYYWKIFHPHRQPVFNK